VNNNQPPKANKQSPNVSTPSFQGVAGHKRPIWRGLRTTPNQRPKGGTIVQTVRAPNLGRQASGWNAVKPTVDPLRAIPANRFAFSVVTPRAYAPPVGANENQNGGFSINY
jgi:hypothetical protein